MDAYNANPSSMGLAIENFSKMPGDKVLILGSMAELGNESQREHALLVDQIKNHNWRAVVLVGSEFEKINHPFHQFKNSEQVKEWFSQQNLENTSILVKGSRSMQMEKAFDN
jgi:UDP-N-acetylmuramoyl-tripeptide--D-alanyl-D-alanine ligase